MSAKANYYKIGLFVMSAIIIAVAAIIIFGAGMFFREEFLVETYMDGSVQGLSVGSPIKFRGVKIGEVKEITFVRSEYKVPSTYVLVRSDIVLELLGLKKEDKKDFLSRAKMATQLGLRFRLASQGLTGVAYIEADYLDPDRFPPLPINWEPKYPYFPSAPSTMTQIKDSINNVLRNLEEADIKAVIKKAGATLDAVKMKVEGIDTNEISSEAKTMLAEFKKTGRRLNTILENPDMDTIVTDASKAIADAKELMSTLSEDLPETVSRLKGAIAVLDRALKRVDNMITSKEYDIEVLVEDLREITRNIRELSESIKKHPSGAIFGKPPPPFKPGGKE